MVIVYSIQYEGVTCQDVFRGYIIERDDKVVSAIFLWKHLERPSYASSGTDSQRMLTTTMPFKVPTKMLLWVSVGVAKRDVVPTEIVASTEPVAALRA